MKKRTRCKDPVEDLMVFSSETDAITWTMFKILYLIGLLH